MWRNIVDCLCDCHQQVYSSECGERDERGVERSGKLSFCRNPPALLLTGSRESVQIYIYIYIYIYLYLDEWENQYVHVIINKSKSMQRSSFCLHFQKCINFLQIEYSHCSLCFHLGALHRNSWLSYSYVASIDDDEVLEPHDYPIACQKTRIGARCHSPSPSYLRQSMCAPCKTVQSS